MKKVKIYRFNLVEIMLAIVILALGMTSVFVLFPAGLNNHKTAMAENSIADMAEMVISHIRATAEIRGTADSMPSVQTASGSEPAFDWDIDPDDADSLWTLRDAGSGYYMIRQLSGSPDDPYVDFAAYARVYQDSNYADELFVPITSDRQDHFTAINSAADNSLNIKALTLSNMVLPLVVEISYPAEKPYADREKAYFRFEIFNDKFELKVAP